MCRPRVLVVAICLVLACGFSASADTIRGCVSSNGALRIVLPGEPCKNTEFAISWNSDGDAGEPGPAGPQGPAGSQGPAGPQGPPGDSSCEAPAPSIIGTIRFGTGAANPIYGLEDGSVAAIPTLGGGGAGGGVSRPELYPISVLQMAGAETAERFGNVVTGFRIAAVEIDIFDAAEGVSVHILLQDVVVQRFELVPGAGPDRPFNRISLDYTKISITSGGVTRCWNELTNSPQC